MSSYGSLAKWYDSLTEDVPYTEFADFYERIFAERGKSVKTVVDLACGTGTLTLIMSARGYEMIGVDASCDMLSVAAQKAGEEEFETPPLFICQELSDLDLYGTVDAAVCSLDALNYVPAALLPEVFRRIFLFLPPGGTLIFDIQPPGRLRALDGQTFVDETEDMLCLWRAQFDEAENALIYGMDIFSRAGSNWRREQEEHVEYAHEPRELVRLLEAAGFKGAAETEDGPTGVENRIFITAEKG